MRITQQMATRRTLDGLQSTASRMDGLQAQLSSGRQITKPSDNPSGTVTALELRSQVQQSAQYQTNANSALSWLSAVDSTMSSVNNNEMQKAHALIVQGLSTGTADSNSRNAIANELDGISAALVSLANSSLLGSPIFGGTTSNTAAFVPTTNLAGNASYKYNGDTGTIKRDVGPSTTVQVNQIGTAVFGADNSNVFDALADMSQRARAGTLTGSDLTKMDGLMGTTSAQQSLAGSTYNQVQVAQSNVTDSVLQYRTQLSTLEDIDVAEMAVSVNSAYTAYQASLATTAKISQRSLLDFLS